jgi:hypothetical protein
MPGARASERHGDGEKPETSRFGNRIGGDEEGWENAKFKIQNSELFPQVTNQQCG